MGSLTRDGFTAKRHTEKVMMPELGADAYANVREMSAQQLHDLRAQHNPPKPESFFDFEFSLLALCLVDDQGGALFADAEDMRANSDLTISTIQRLAKAALQVSGIAEPKN